MVIDGIEDQWRLAKSRTIARDRQRAELAAIQAFPDRATVHLAIYEALLGVSCAPTTVERQAAVAAAFTAALDALIPTIRAGLMAIDATIDVVTVPDDDATEAQFGKYLADRTDLSAYGGRLAARLPNFSTHYVLCACYPGGHGMPACSTRPSVT